MTQEQIDALKAQGYHFKATPDGEVQFTPEEEAEWAAWQEEQANIPPPRRLIPKSVVQERVNAIGKWGAVIGALMPGGVPSIYYGRWFTPDHPNVFFDDADMLAMLNAVGCTSEEIAVITA